MKCRHALTGALMALALTTTAHAGPRVTEAADALPRGDCELEAAIGRESALGAPRLRAWEVVAGCGVGAQTQVNLGWARATAAGLSADAHGLDAKTTLVDPVDDRTGWALAYGMTALKTAGGGTRLDEVTLTAVATRNLPKGWLGHANLGWLHSRSDKRSTTAWSLGVESTSDLVLAADVFGDDRGRPWVSAGIGHALSGGFSMSLGLARQLDRARASTITLGAKLAF